jgi:hypothetical protein
MKQNRLGAFQNERLWIMILAVGKLAQSVTDYKANM